MARDDPGHSRASLRAVEFARLQQAWIATIVTVIAAVALALTVRLVPAPGPEAVSDVARATPVGVNPNTATAAELTVLPGIGEHIAAAIVAFRESEHDTSRSGKPVFARPEDLDRVRGIGPKTVEKLRPHLQFDD